MFSLPVRSVNKGGHRLCGPTCSGQPLTVTLPRQFSALTALVQTTTSSGQLCWEDCWRCQEAREILLFVRLSSAQPSCHGWHDQEGTRRTVTQAEGGEQGDPLMPLLFFIGIQGALEEVARLLERGEQLCAFLLCQLSRVETLCTVLSDAFLRHAGIQLHQGKTKACNNAGVIPDNVEDLSPEVWQPKGTPIGSEQCKSPGRWQNALRRSANFRECSQQSLIFSALGRCCCKVPIPERTIRCAPCLQPVGNILHCT